MIGLAYASWDRLSPVFSRLGNSLRHCNLLRGFIPLKSLQEIEVAAGNILYRFSIHRTKLLPDRPLEVAV